MSQKAMQGFEALRNDNGNGWRDVKMLTNNNIPNYGVRTPNYRPMTPTSRGTQTIETTSTSWSTPPSKRVPSAALQALRAQRKSPQEAVRGASASTPPIEGCICFRGHTSVACCSCGLMLAGRVRMQCPSHPNTIHLMDVERCPECCSATLTELRTT